AAVDRPGLDRAVGPGVGGVVGEVLGEVLGGAGVVRAVHRDDGRVGQLDVGVELRDRRVVPRGDVLGEDPGDHLGREVQVLDALEVEHDRDRGDVDGQVEGLLTVADLGGGGELLLVQGGVGAGELHLTGQELLAAGAGAGGVVGDV